MTNKRNEKTIYYLATKTQVVNQLSANYRRQEFEFIQYNISNSLEDAMYFLIIEPISIGQRNFAVSRLWKYWLTKHFPDIHLIVAGFIEPKSHPNFLSLLRPPERLSYFLKETEPVSAFPLQHKETGQNYGLKNERYLDLWEIGLPHTGEPATKVMEQFIRGHDKANSFSTQLTNLRKELLHLETAQMAKQPTETYYKNIEKEFWRLLNRWYRYEPLLPYLPFMGDLQAINQKLEAFKESLTNQRWAEQATKSNLKSIEMIGDILIEKLMPIVHAEDYW